MEILSCRGLRRSFGTPTAVGDVSFGIDAGETYGLLGPNGAGKTTVISMVALYPDLTGRENLRFFARLYGLRGARMRTRVAEMLRMVGLADRAGDLVSTDSGGMKRRLNIGAGLPHRPRLLILDEPTVGAEPQSRNAILASVEALAAEGMAVLSSCT